MWSYTPGSFFCNFFKISILFTCGWRPLQHSIFWPLSYTRFLKWINFRLQKFSLPLIPLCFSTYITILLIISLFIYLWPDHLVLYTLSMFFFVIFSKFQFYLSVATGLYTTPHSDLYHIFAVSNYLMSDYKNAHPPQFCCFNRYITSMKIISLFIHPWPNYLVL